jgi:hypothetical protein
VLASPSDVQAERDAADSVIDSLNRMLLGGGFAAALRLVRWEKDVYPGLHHRGPQGLIDDQLRIEECDILIGVFWKRFGTPVGDAESGTAHEIQRAIETWNDRGTPQVMVYFRETHEQAIPPDEEEQFRKVQNFKQQLRLKYGALVGKYEDDADFCLKLYEHLHSVVMQRLRPPGPTDADFSHKLYEHLHSVVMQPLPPGPTSGPLSFLRVSASADTVCARRESFAELMGDVFLRCSYASGAPHRSAVDLTVTLSASAPITSGYIERDSSRVVLCEVGRPGAAAVIPGAGGGPGSWSVVFSGVHLDMGPGETRVLQISNLRCSCSGCPTTSAGVGFVLVYVTITGLPIEVPRLKVATVRKGIDFEARTADNSQRLAGSGFELSQSAVLTETRVATLRYTEGFLSAFKSRAPVRDRIWSTYEGDAVRTGETGSLCAVFATDGGDVQVAGLADYGTQFQAHFSRLQPGVRIFVSARELGNGKHARLLLSGGEPMMIGDLEARELPIAKSSAMAVWEVVTPFCSERSAGFLDFAVFASYVADPVADPPSVGTSVVFGGFSPQLPCSSSNGPIPVFSSTISTSFYNILTVVA